MNNSAHTEAVSLFLSRTRLLVCLSECTSCANSSACVSLVDLFVFMAVALIAVKWPTFLHRQIGIVLIACVIGGREGRGGEREREERERERERLFC